MTTGQVAPERIGIDVGGVGAGTVNEAKRLGRNVTPLDSGSSPRWIAGNSERFQNLRCQMWWQMRSDLQFGRIALPADEQLFADLIAVKWTTRNSVIVLEDKAKVRATLGRSPDKGDAAAHVELGTRQYSHYKL